MCHPAVFLAMPTSSSFATARRAFQRAVRAGDPGAAAVVNEFHPRLGSAQPGSPELDAFTRADAQLVVARQFGFPSWPRLKAHLELVADYARSPHHEPVGGPLADQAEIVDEFLRLVTLNYGDDDPDRLARAEALLLRARLVGDRERLHDRGDRGARRRPATCWPMIRLRRRGSVVRIGGSRCST